MNGCFKPFLPMDRASVPSRLGGKIAGMRWMIATFAWFLVVPAWAQGPQNVLLVVNSNSHSSRIIGDYYLHKRQVPATNVCSIHAHEDEEIDRATFDGSIRRPVLDCLVKGGL